MSPLAIGKSIVIQASLSKVKLSDLHPGQTWVSKNKRGKITILKQWDSYYIIQDKFGDQFKRSPNALLAEIQKDNFTLISADDIVKALDQIGVILLPFFNDKKFMLSTLRNGIARMVKS
ncbi:MAG: hypothetical protein HQK50_14090 [Oligoflexia bacterium]|nr:hypothetical protein [Oligoflexia bacterium]